MNKELRSVVKALREKGLRVVVDGHVKVYAGRKLAAVIASTSSDHRWIKNLERDLRKAGALLRGERLQGHTPNRRDKP